jgi:hypothetical protein
VTGGASGIGHAAVRAFVHADAQIMIADLDQACATRICGGNGPGFGHDAIWSEGGARLDDGGRLTHTWAACLLRRSRLRPTGGGSGRDSAVLSDEAGAAVRSGRDSAFHARRGRRRQVKQSLAACKKSRGCSLAYDGGRCRLARRACGTRRSPVPALWGDRA